MTDRITVAAMALAAVSVALALLPIAGPPDGDFAFFLIPWMDKIRELGWRSISGEFSEYPPTYIYLLNIAAMLPVGTVAAVKLINVPFVALCAWAVGRLANSSTAFAAALVAPTLLLNAFAFGQADAILNAFLLLFVLSATRERPSLAAVMFGLALSFKLQAMFLSPVVALLLLSGRMRLRDAALIPLVYVTMMVPAALAGRPWAELLGVYWMQANLGIGLSLDAPNPWWFLRAFVDYRTGVVLGCLAGALVGGWIAARGGKLNSLLVVACLSALLLPYVLPKMTPRYFLTADLLLLALAFRDPRLWPVAALCQIGSFVACLSYFFTWGTALFAFLPMTAAAAWLLYATANVRISLGVDHAPVEKDSCTVTVPPL